MPVAISAPVIECGAMMSTPGATTVGRYRPLASRVMSPPGRPVDENDALAPCLSTAPTQTTYGETELLPSMFGPPLLPAANTTTMLWLYAALDMMLTGSAGS